MPEEGPTLAELGETELIRRLGAFAPPGQFADDAAVLTPPGGCPLVVNTDVLVEGVHFSEATTVAYDVGWRAATANLSDLAAMGCDVVIGLTVGLVAPGSTPWPWVEGAYRGLQAVLRRYGGHLLGGDCSGGRQRLLAITALGALPRPGPEATIRRGDGRPGDLLVSTGPHGLSRLGLALLQDDPTLLGTPVPAGLARRALRAHRRPRPRLDVVAPLAACRPAGVPWRVGGCDSSDGLAAAAQVLALAAGCGALLERERLPLDPAQAGLPGAEAWCLWGGEDFELLLALPPAWAHALVAALPGATVVGSLAEPRRGTPLRWAGSGAPVEEGDGAYRHFGTPGTGEGPPGP